MRYGVVIPARNERKYIGLTLRSLMSQSILPTKIVVVDDSSSDGTADIAEELGAMVIRIKRKFNENMVGTPYIAYLINKGFEVLESIELDYVMVSGADCFYPSNYVEELARRMKQDQVVIASGVALGERSSEYGIRGAGRLISAKWFKTIGYRYPLIYGFEPWLVLKALSQGYGVRVYNDLKFKLLRPTIISPRKAFLWGKAMRVIGYWWPYAISRSLLLSIKSPTLSINMIAGFISSAEARDDVSDFIKKLQKTSFIKKFRKIIIKIKKWLK